MRGKLCQCGLRRPRSRITPADAGKTRLCGSLSARPEDHPRGCGENLAYKLVEAGVNRITPADAGKTALAESWQARTKDHPRGCGENHCTIPHSNVTLGSPPRMRGKLRQPRVLQCVGGITPADAGKTWYILSGYYGMVGSPPRMRGKLFAGVNGVSASGITPADAGKTCNRENLIKQREDHPRGCGENLQ